MANETITSTDHALRVSITKGADVTNFFTKKTNQEFIDWFNENCANKGFWKDPKRGDFRLGTTPEVRQRFSKIWDQFQIMFDAGEINLAQFICLQSIFINEMGASLKPVTEKVGRAGHPGLAYAFDAISGVKISYNQSPSKTAFELFNDPLFIKTHGQLAQADKLKQTTDLRWKSTVYPQDAFPTSTDPAESGFIREADFFKFRGRGFVQTTWRSNYILLIQYIQRYTGANAKILSYKLKWTGLKPDDVATVSTNDDWDDLFQNTNMIIPCAGVAAHNKASGKYLSLSSDLNAILGQGPGSIFRMGRKISGSANYATTFQGRVIQIMMALNKPV
jgi:hypothetical protein